MKKLKLLLLLIVAVASLSAFKCGKNSTTPEVDNSVIAQVARSGNGTVITSREKSQTTPKGARIFGKFELASEQLNLVDSGLDAVFAAARTDGFTNKLSYDFYEIFTPPYACVPSPESRTPSFLVRGDAYDATEFDQYNPRGRNVADGIGVVYAAEMILSLGSDGSTILVGQMYVCPDTSVLANAVQHGGDHILLANNPYEADGYNYFWCSIYHTEIGHPLLPRGGRCPTATNLTKPIFDAQVIESTKEQKQSADKLFNVQNFEIKKGLIINPVK